ncbi:MAG: methyltransferase domain-containing protein [Desulfomonilaceae bacterium]
MRRIGYELFSKIKRCTRIGHDTLIFLNQNRKHANILVRKGLRLIRKEGFRACLRRLEHFHRIIDYHNYIEVARRMNKTNFLQEFIPIDQNTVTINNQGFPLKVLGNDTQMETQELFLSKKPSIDSMNAQYFFSLDTPFGNCIEELSTFSGWCFTPDQSRDVELKLRLNGKPYAGLRYGLYRPDVGQNYSKFPQSLFSGFSGELYVTSEELSQNLVSVEIVVEGPQKSDFILFKSDYKVRPCPKAKPKHYRLKSYSLNNLLRCPDCAGELDIDKVDGQCGNCNRKIYVRQSIPHILRSRDLPALCLNQIGFTHPYGPKVSRMMDQFKDGLILDFGSGNTPTNCMKSNVVYLDTIQYPNTDIVTNTPKLPFKDSVFDFIVSQAVFEHIPDPFLTALEFYRILKPGGYVYIDTAFMQPLHSDPTHYFNMTLEGLLKVMIPFQEIESGVGPHQNPSYGILMSLDAIIPHVLDHRWEELLKLLRDSVRENQADFDTALGAYGRRALAAGHYFIGKKLMV